VPNILKGFCTKCGAKYAGWALMKPAERKCEKCGDDLEIYCGGKRVNPADFPTEETAVKDENDSSRIIWKNNKHGTCRCA
jgi:hypothetical protein